MVIEPARVALKDWLRDICGSGDAALFAPESEAAQMLLASGDGLLGVVLHPHPFEVRCAQARHPARVGDVADPRGMARLSAAHLEWMRVQNYSEQTVSGREKHLRRFTLWCEERSITRPTDVTKPILERY